ncbi:MAG: hemolysin family protein [Pyrinomonadaceae bacterium]
MEIEITVAILLLVMMTFLATVDMAFVQLSDLSLRRLASDTDDDSRVNSFFLRQILENRPRFRFALSAAIQILLIIFSVLVTIITLRFFPLERTQLLLISLGIGLMLSGVFRQFIPRLLTFRNPEKVLLLFLPVIRPIYGSLAFIADPFGLANRDKTTIENTAVPSTNDETNSESAGEEADDTDAAENIQTLIEAGEAEGIIEERERELIETIVGFGDTLANEVMTPRTEIEAVPITATLGETLDLIIEEKYSRLPVYRDQIDNVEGMIYVRDLLQFWRDDKEPETIESLPNLLRPVYFVPETKPIAELLKEMQNARVQMAMIVDEYGGVAGLVTIEDILEELVGEIEDEDTEQEEIIEIFESSDKSYFDVLGSVEIGKIERILDMEIETDDFTTIAGLVTSEIGYVPKSGEKLNLRGLDVEILKADERKINLLRLQRSQNKKRAPDSRD